MSSRKIFKIGEHRDAVELENALNDVINGEDSELDIDPGDDDDVDDPTYVEDPNEASDSSGPSSDDEEPPENIAAPEPSTSNRSDSAQETPTSRRVYWKTSEIFEPLAPAPEYIQPDYVAIDLPPKDYFTKYIPFDIYSKIAFCSNQVYLLQTGKILNTNEREIRVFFGITIVMAYLKYPRIRMYWEGKTRVPIIAEKMRRDRYFLIRSHLKLVNDSEVSQEEQSRTKFWKVQPLISCVRNACLLNSCTTDVCVDEQMIPFSGKHEARQVVKGKPNPVGLKNFVLENPNGLPLDFFIYEGKGDTIVDDESVKLLDIGGKVVARLSARLPAGCTIYMDRYFTSIHLLELLHWKVECSGTGTLQKNRIPNNCNFKSDAQLRRLGRGSYSQLVSSSGQVAAVKWFDNKPVILASTVDGAEPSDECRRYDKKAKRYLNIQRPNIVKKYNEKMGGVDYLDRMISYYRISARTKKWTVRLIFHFFDFAIAAGWIEYKQDQEKLGTSGSKILDHLSFREAIADFLLEYDIESSDDESAAASTSAGPPNKRAKQQHPSDLVRTRKVDHIPIILETKNRCRLPGCRSNGARHQCPTCKVILCLVSGRNCYKAYHEL